MCVVFPDASVTASASASLVTNISWPTADQSVWGLLLSELQPQIARVQPQIAH